MKFGYTPAIQKAFQNGCLVAWGCRAIFGESAKRFNGKILDLVPDRQSWFYNEGKKEFSDEEKKALAEEHSRYLNSGPLDKLFETTQSWVDSGILKTTDSDDAIFYEDERVTIWGNPNASCGYLYLAAVFKAE